MRTRTAPLLREEAARFVLRFTCDDCAHFDPPTGRCGHGYPPAPRQGALDDDELAFCKEFELA